MSAPRLTLRPPPNIEFVQGYPGIPPGAPDRPQAAVKGTIELRVAPEGVKAKWVRIELRKVEVLPGGGVANTFFDFVGQSPINVWQSSEEYGTLQTQDFPFYIRIPESIPPSIALEKAAGIKYELIASVCVKGKRGLLRRDKPSIATTSQTIIIDKHELHSTWPIYQQPESRNHTEGSVTLIVERERTCYGPGDRVDISAIVRTDSLHTEILRGYEFTLRETTVFRGSPTSGKKGAPAVRAVHIGEQRVPLNVTLYGGTQHKAELNITIPQQHTTATINTARHIDITYTLVVKAQMGTGQNVVLELPVIVSNWPRAVSVEAMRRIGVAPNVAVHGHATPETAVAIGKPIVSASILNKNMAASDADVAIGRPSTDKFSTAPSKKTSVPTGLNKPDEFGVSRVVETVHAKSVDGTPSVTSSTDQSSGYVQTIGGPQGIASASSSGGARIAPYADETTAFARPRASSARAQSGRLTITNHNEAELAEHAQAQAKAQAQAIRSQSNRPSTAQTVGGSSSRRWVSAEEEKRRLYETAIANVERVQGVRPRSPPSDQSEASTPTPSATSAASSPATNNKSAKSTRWLSAEEEKMKLFNHAQAAVARKHGLNGSSYDSPAPSLHGRSDSVNSQQQTVSSHHDSEAAGGSSRTPPTKSRTPQFPSADEEKAALRRYMEAKAAVDRTHNATYGAPPSPPLTAPNAYQALYPERVSPPPASQLSDSPPPFITSPSQPSYLSEKERLRRAYEAQDAAAMAAQAPSMPDIQPALVPSMPTPPLSPPGYMSSADPPVTDAAAEKDMLRRRFEAQDAAALGAFGAPMPPPRVGGRPQPSPPGQGSRPQPMPPRSPGPGAPSGSQPLSALEEKARLKAMYEAEDRTTQAAVMSSPFARQASLPPMNGIHRQDTFIPDSIPPPPPLMPRPPKEYIQETQEEDARTKARLQAIDKEIANLAGPMKTELILSSFSADLVDSNGNPMPTQGPPASMSPPPRLEIE